MRARPVSADTQSMWGVPMRLFSLLMAALLIGVACSGGDDDDSPSAVATAAEGAASDVADDAEATAEDAGASTDAQELAALYISAGGSGVAVRSACEDGARTGRSLADGTAVTVMQVGEGACAGWSLVFAGSGSWVRDEYLSADAPPHRLDTPRHRSAAATTNSGSTAGGGGSSATTSTGGSSGGSTTPPLLHLSSGFQLPSHSRFRRRMARQ